MSLTPLRRWHGLRWPSDTPPIRWREIGMVAIVIGVYGLLDHVDQLADRAVQIEQRAQAAERAADIYSATVQVVKDCEAGRATHYYYRSNQQVYECPKSM